MTLHSNTEVRWNRTLVLCRFQLRGRNKRTPTGDFHRRVNTKRRNWITVPGTEQRLRYLYQL
jgi:hypothetical protein